MNWRIFFLIIAVLAVFSGIVFLTVLMERESPVISFAKEIRFISGETPVEFSVMDEKSGLRHVKVWLKQGQEIKDVFFEEFPYGKWWLRGGVPRRDIKMNLDYKALALDQGPATLVVAAQDRSLWKFRGNVSLLKFPVMVDTIPPRIDLISTAHNVRSGGTGLVVYSLNEKAATTGVEVNGLFFRGYQDIKNSPGSYVSYFTLPHETSDTIKVFLVAEDHAGNIQRRSLAFYLLTGKSRRDTITVSDAFLDRKMPEFIAVDPSLGSDMALAFLKVNRDWRDRDHSALAELSRKSRPERLWDGKFLQMDNSKKMAGYAEHRNYSYKGKILDHQVHLGIDLASTAAASVPAGNSGVVEMTGDLGIYGQIVLIDHGQGLMSLYAHLSNISVEAGQKIEKGQTIGSTGSTGMAGGDHLHFSMLVNGQFADPIEWLDQRWIDHNIESKLSILASRSAR